MVISRHGRHRFQTGMVTAGLLQRGLRMADAVEVARAVRDSIANKSEITTEKLVNRIQKQVEKTLGSEVAAQLSKNAPSDFGDMPMVETPRGRFPFSKGVVLRRLDTAGLQLEAAMPLVETLERWVRARGDELLVEEAVDEEAARLLQGLHGEAVARRFRL